MPSWPGGAAPPPCRTEAALCAKLGLKPASAIFLRLKWLGFFDDRPLPASCACSRDVVRLLFGERLSYRPEERDLVVLKDEIVAFYPATGKRKRHTSTLIDFGIPDGDSSIARTTGLPPGHRGPPVPGRTDPRHRPGDAHPAGGVRAVPGGA